ncbi:MAG: hypothetical protein EBZ50_14920, partial [Alphaproteobacteria bacterium]|nr:hypothetical protein [Alphaproteobacteria bacterium]
ELDGFSKADVSAVKGFLSRKNDRFRPSYARLAADHPRQFVLCGTINPDGNGYLRDPTGGRRFWPVRINRKIDIEALKRDRDQLWAEAAAAFNAGEKWWIEDAEIEALAKAAQAARSEIDPMAAAIERFLADKTLSAEADNKQPAVSSREIIMDALALEARDCNTANGRRVAAIMRKLGWEQGGQERGSARRGERLYRPGPEWDKRQADAKAADEEAKAARAAAAAKPQPAAAPSPKAKAPPQARPGASAERFGTDTSFSADGGFGQFDDFDVDDPLV